MHTKSIIKRLIKVDDIVVENANFEQHGEEEELIIKVRPTNKQVSRCPKCGKRCPGYDWNDRLRRWRSLDMGSTRVYLEAISPRVKCTEHGIVVSKTPWARHSSDFTKEFEMAVTWLTLHATAADVAEYFRIDWHTVGNIAKRVQETLEQTQPNRYDDLEKIGIDETSYKKGYKYMTVVVNHKTGSLVWAKKGHGKEVLTEFFKELSDEQCAKIKLVSADGAQWIASCIKEFCPNAERCIDPFHVVQWANEALDEVRKSVVRAALHEAANDGKAERSKKKIIQRMYDMPCSKTRST